MGGVAKGLLVAPNGEPIVTRTARILDELEVPFVLVGKHPAYAELDLEVLVDDPSATGPLAGLLALLAWGASRGVDRVLAIACDMPFFDRELVRRLVEAPAAPIIAPRREYWEPLFARYDVSVLAIARSFAERGERKLQRLLDEAGATPLELSPEEHALLTDWDTP